MKKYLLILIFTASQFAIAQKSSGVVTYKVQTDEINVTNKNINNVSKRIIESFPKYAKYLSFTLNFTKKEALFSLDKTLELDGNDRIFLKYTKTRAGKATYYCNLETNTRLVEKSFLGNEFLVNSIFNDTPWKITNETKKIDGYTCYKAYYLDSDNPLLFKPRKVTAWFTLQVPVPYGPKGYGGLPGLILELKEGPLTFFVSDITLKSLNLKIKRPIKGKKIAKEEFAAIVLNKSKQFEKSK
ncbi:GLPGLI family protein [Kordia sp.]|uniref:GLPGLI family protein n=1 Tax=Kordia sp. TaxID=1965332 RepID=UPI003D29919A